MTISPEALEKARAITHMFCLFPPSDKQALEIQIAAALQAEHDAAAPKLPDDLTERVERLRDFGRAYPLNVFPEVTDGEREWLRTERPGLQDRIAASMGRHFAEHAAEAASTIQSLVARNAELEHQWCPISAAPKHPVVEGANFGPMILLGSIYGQRAVGYWGRGTGNQREGWVNPHDHMVMDYWGAFTHWQPLPEIPETENDA